MEMTQVLQIVPDNSRVIINASNDHNTALVVIGQYDNQFYMTNCASDCPVHVLLSIHARVATDMSKCCKPRIAPLNGFGNQVFEQSKLMKPICDNMTYCVLSTESNYKPPPHEWVHMPL